MTPPNRAVTRSQKKMFTKCSSRLISSKNHRRVPDVARQHAGWAIVSSHPAATSLQWKTAEVFHGNLPVQVAKLYSLSWRILVKSIRFLYLFERFCDSQVQTKFQNYSILTNFAVLCSRLLLGFNPLPRLEELILTLEAGLLPAIASLTGETCPEETPRFCRLWGRVPLLTITSLKYGVFHVFFSRIIYSFWDGFFPSFLFEESSRY